MNSLAIKLDVSDNNQNDLNNLLVSIGIKPQKRRFHCTVGFIDKLFETSRDAEEFVQELRKSLIVPSPLPFTYQEPRFLFRHVIGLVPDSFSLEILRKANADLHATMEKIAGDRYTLNSQTTGYGYHPHITLWRQRHKDKRFRMLKDAVADGQLGALELVEYSYTVL